MRKLILCLGLGVAGSVLAAAAPASAQYYARPGYGYGYGWNQYSENLRGIETRIQNVIASINSAPYDQQYQLRREAITLDRQVQYAARRGIDPWRVIGNRLEQLEVQVQRAVHYGNYGYGDRYGRGHEGYRNRDENDRD